jgi:hypothetical protein
MSMDHNAMIAVIAAHRDGKEIEARYRNRPQLTNQWAKCTVGVSWDFNLFEYRIKPEPPKPREWWLYLCPRYASFHSFNSRTQEQAEELKCGECEEVIRVREVLP